MPVLNRAPNGPIAMVSPANTYVGLTHGGPGTVAGEPGKYYPTGKRNYARVVAADDYQGAADALLAQSLGVKKVYILNDKEAYGLGVASNFRNAAKRLGLTVAGFTAWDGKASSYEALGVKIKASGAQGIFLGGLICENGGKLIKDLRNAVGPNVKLMMPDGFTPVSATDPAGWRGFRRRNRVGCRSAEQRAQGRRQGVRPGLHEGRQAGTGSLFGVRSTGGRGDGRSDRTVERDAF